ncbi:MAG: DNA recombination protein RmuC, partial [Pseudomonadota bacterium]
MITIAGTTYDLNDPLVLAALGGLAVVLLMLILLILSARAAGRSARAMAPLAMQMTQLGQRVQNLGDGQERLAGGLHHVSEAQAQSQTAMLQLMEKRLSEVSGQMNENLQGS